MRWRPTSCGLVAGIQAVAPPCFGLRPPLVHVLELAAFLVESDIALARIISAFAVVVAFDRAADRILWREVETRREHLFHEKAGGDRLQRIVDGLGDSEIGRAHV